MNENMKSQCPIKLPAVVLPFSRSSFFQICARHMCLPAHILHVGRTFIFQSLATDCLSASSSLPVQVLLPGRILINLHYNLLHIFDLKSECGFSFCVFAATRLDKEVEVDQVIHEHYLC